MNLFLIIAFFDLLYSLIMDIFCFVYLFESESDVHQGLGVVKIIKSVQFFCHVILSVWLRNGFCDILRILDSGPFY